VRAASGSVSIVGWARRFLEGPNGAAKVAQRIDKGRPFDLEAWGRLADESSPTKEPRQLTSYDVEAVNCLSRGNEVATILRRRAKSLSVAPAGSPRRLAVEASVAAESFDLPQLDASELSADVAEVLQELVARQPEVALCSLNEHARRRRRDGAACSQKTPDALVRLWAAYDDGHVHTVRSLDRSELWAKLLVQGALAARLVDESRGRRRV
jgi:hypothetical protein